MEKPPCQQSDYVDTIFLLSCWVVTLAPSVKKIGAVWFFEKRKIAYDVK